MPQADFGSGNKEWAYKLPSEFDGHRYCRCDCYGITTVDPGPVFRVETQAVVLLMDGRFALVEVRMSGYQWRFISEKEAERHLDDAARYRGRYWRDLLDQVNLRIESGLILDDAYNSFVRAANNDEVLVIFEVGNDVVEQSYTKEQFVDNQLPEVGDKLRIITQITRIPPKPQETTLDELEKRPRRNRIPIPREF